MSNRRASRRQFIGTLAASSVFANSGFFLRSSSAEQTESSPPRQTLFTPAARRAVERGVALLATRQNEDGSFGKGGYARNAAVVALCGMSFLSQGSTPGRGTHGQVLNRCLDFILNIASESGVIYVPEFSDRGPMYSHGFSTLFLAEAYGTSLNASVREKLGRAVQLIVNSQNDEGGWRYEARPHEADISVTACQVMALRAAKNAGVFVPANSIERAVEFVKRSQNPDGGFMYMRNQPGQSSFPRSAAAVVTLNCAGIYDSDEVKRGLAYLKQHGSLSAEAEQNYFLYGHYYAVQAMWHAGGEYWSNWYPAIREMLLARQAQSGLWNDAISAEYGTAMACLILQMPGSYLPIFQR